jgi:S1-C subfamily serine protease
VVKVVNGQPGAAAGILPGDAVATVNGKPIQDHPEFCFALMGRKPGESLQLGLVRDNKSVEANVKLGARAKPDGVALLKRFGLTAVPLDDAKAQAISMRVRRGVVISEVAKGSPWDYEKLEAPPMPGDVLARIDGIRPQNLDDVGLILDRIKLGQAVNMVLLRRNGEVDTRIDLKTGLSAREGVSRPQNQASQAANSSQGAVAPQSRVVPRKNARVSSVPEPRTVAPQGGFQHPDDLPQPSN